MNALQLRSAAAIELVRDRVLNSELALSLVVWPPAKLQELTERVELRRGSRWTEEHRRRALELADEGLSQREIALRVCGDVRQRSTVQDWLRRRPALLSSAP